MILEIKYNLNKVSNSSRVGEATGCVIGILGFVCSPRTSFKYHTIEASDSTPLSSPEYDHYSYRKLGL